MTYLTALRGKRKNGGWQPVLTLAAAGFVGILSTAAPSNVHAEGTSDPNASIRIGSLYEPQNLDNTAGAGQGINEAFNGNVYEAPVPV